MERYSIFDWSPPIIYEKHLSYLDHCIIESLFYSSLAFTFTEVIEIACISDNESWIKAMAVKMERKEKL